MRRLLPIAILVAYGIAFGAVAVGRGMPAVDDHPVQFARLWHALERSLPDRRWTADWNPDAWGGYPDAQFSGPGLLLLGGALRLLSVWQLAPEPTYQLLCTLAWLLPGLATFWLLRATLGDPWLALPPALVALTVSAGLDGGVESGLRAGGLTARLAMGVVPLLLLALRPWIERGRAPRWAPLAAAAAVLVHPQAAAAPVLLLLSAALVVLLLRPERRTLRTAAVLLALSALLTAFWAVPFLARWRWVVAPVAGDADPVTAITAQPLLLLILLGALLAWLPALARRRPFHVFLAAIPVLLILVAAGAARLFRPSSAPIDPGTLTDATVVTALCATGLALGALLTRLSPARAHPAARAVVSLAAVIPAALLPAAPGEQPGLTLWPRAAQWPTWAEVSRARDLASLWRAIPAGPDRVLLTSSAVPVGATPPGQAAHSHALARASIPTGREILPATPPHSSPVAAIYHAGPPARPSRGAGAPGHDEERILGFPFAALAPETFDLFARRLRVAHVVVPTRLVPRAGFLGDHYAPAATAAGFTVLERRDRPWSRIERITHRRYRVTVSPTGGVWISTGIPAYPLWQAKSPQGPLETREDSWGLLEFRVPVDVFEAELVYAEGPIEWLSLVATLVGAVVWIGWARRARDAPASRTRASPSAGGRARPRRR